MLKPSHKYKNTCHLATGNVGMDAAWEYLLTEITRAEEFGVENGEFMHYPILIQAGLAKRMGTLIDGFKDLFTVMGFDKNVVVVKIDQTTSKGEELVQYIENAREDFAVSRVFISARKNIFMPKAIDENANPGPDNPRDIILLQNKMGVSADKIQGFMRRNKILHVKCTQIDNLPQSQTPQYNSKQLEQMFTVKIKGSPVALNNFAAKLRDYAEGRLRNMELISTLMEKPNSVMTELEVVTPLQLQESSPMRSVN